MRRGGWVGGRVMCSIDKHTRREVITAQDEECVYDKDEIIMQIGVDLLMTANAVMCFRPS